MLAEILLPAASLPERGTSLYVAAAASGARVLHLATHTSAGPGGPSITLADGELNAREVIGRNLAPELVVLASCATARRRGLGMWGSLGAAFLAAGSEGVLAALLCRAAPLS